MGALGRESWRWFGQLRMYAALRRRAEFARVTRRGRRRSTQFLTCVTLAGHEQSRVGFTVSAQVGNAVARNRVRRRLQAILDSYALAEIAPRDIVFIARPGAAELTYHELQGEVERTLGPAS